VHLRLIVETDHVKPELCQWQGDSSSSAVEFQNLPWRKTPAQRQIKPDVLFVSQMLSVVLFGVFVEIACLFPAALFLV